MGGPGAGHKSWKARQSRLVNIRKARAARRRAPLPWRSGLESRIIEQLVYQWFLEVGSSRLEAGPRHQDAYQQQIDRKSTRLNSSHSSISYAVFCLKKKKKKKKKKKQKNT